MTDLSFEVATARERLIRRGGGDGTKGCGGEEGRGEENLEEDLGRGREGRDDTFTVVKRFSIIVSESTRDRNTCIAACVP